CEFLHWRSHLFGRPVLVDSPLVAADALELLLDFQHQRATGQMRYVSWGWFLRRWEGCSLNIGRLAAWRFLLVIFAPGLLGGQSLAFYLFSLLAFPLGLLPRQAIALHARLLGLIGLQALAIGSLPRKPLALELLALGLLTRLALALCLFALGFF